MRTLFAIYRAARFRYSVHPPHPRTSFLLVWLVLVLSGQSAKGQLLNYATYSLSTKAYFNAAWTAERTEFLNIQKGKNWSYVPSVGLVFGLPSVNLNTGQIAALKTRQAENRAKLKSMEMRYELQLNEALNVLRIEIEKMHMEGEKLAALGAVQDTKRKIFEIHSEAFQKKQIKPLDFYRERLNYEAAVQEYEISTRTYHIGVLNVERIAHYNTPQEKIAYTNDEPESTNHLLDIAPDRLPSSIFTKPSSGE